MANAHCIFEDCNCKIISVNDNNSIYIPNEILDVCGLLQRSKTKSISEDALEKAIEEQEEEKEEQEKNFLVVSDVWDFDNVCVSKDIPPSRINSESLEPFQYEHADKIWKITKCPKYLICADCEKGPIGLVCNVTCQKDSNPITEPETPIKEPTETKSADPTTVYLLSLKSIRLLRDAVKKDIAFVGEN